jgi:hypothetical protein
MTLLRREVRNGSGESASHPGMCVAHHAPLPEEFVMATKEKLGVKVKGREMVG